MIGLLMALTGSRGLALIFSSTGDATYNTTPPTGSPTNCGWQWQGRWKGATGTPIAPHFFITAGHLGGNVGDTFLFIGVTYVTTGKNASPGSDLMVWQVGGTFPSYAPLYTGSAEVGMNAVLFGRGVARGNAVNVAGLGEDALRGWQWMSTATAGTLRWGENTIELAQYFAPNDPFAANGQLLVMDFDRFNGSNSNEVTLGNFDSGGGLFLRDPVDNRWKLAGVNVDAEYANRLTAAGATFNASIFDIGGLYYDEAGDVVGPVGTDPFILGANGVTDTPSRLYSARISANIPRILGIPGFPPLNTAPQISPVSNQTVDEGIPLTVTLAGSDADVPAQTQVYSNRLTQVTNLPIDFSAAQVAATLGANSLEMVRVGPATATDYWLIYDQVRLEVVAGGLGLSRVASGEAGAAVAYLRSPGSTGNNTVIHGRITLEGADYLTLTFGQPEPAPEGGSPQVEFSKDLVHWSPADVAILRDSVSEGWRTTMVRDLTPLGQTAQRFLRLGVVPGSFSRVPTNQ